MSWMESQIETRAKLDAELSERAYSKLAASVTSARNAPSFRVDDTEQVDGAIRACLNSYGIEANEAPSSVRGLEERLNWMCRPSGTMHRPVRLVEGWQKQAFGAMLGKFDTGDVVALLPRGIRGYNYVDPNTGNKVKVTSEVASHITEEAELFYRPLPAKPLKIIDLVKFILHVFNRGDYLVVFIAALAVALIGLILPWANQIAFGTVAPSGQAGLILPLAVLLLGATVSSALIGACHNLIMARMSMKLDVVTEAATFVRVLALPPSFFKQYSSGNLANRISLVTQLTTQMTSIALGSGLSAILSLVYIFQIGMFAPSLAIPALTVALVQAALTVAITLATMRYERRTLESSSKLSGTVTALLNGVQKIKLAGAEERAFAKWADGYADYAQAAYNRPTLLRALPAFVSFVGLLGGIAIYYFAGTTNVSVANYMAFNAAYGQITAAIMAVAAIAGQIAQIKPQLEMVNPILEATPETAEDKPSVESISGALEVTGVSFRYGENLPNVLDGLSFKVKQGEYVAIVGESGCGKSTVMRLLLGFEKPDFGSVFYGRHDVQKVDLRSLRQHIGVVAQDGSLFMGDIFSNITISAPSATLDDAWEAAELAGIADDIRKMPMGMQTIVTEGGGGVSGGQRQRLMIARAICGKKRMLMFDEATSALDNKTQKHVSDSLDKLNCTRIVIAHRLSTVKNCDRILVLQGGKIAEEGTYEQLMAKNGLFAELVARQRIEKEDA